jgi:hypothetical protein
MNYYWYQINNALVNYGNCMCVMFNDNHSNYAAKQTHSI